MNSRRIDDDSTKAPLLKMDAEKLNKIEEDPVTKYLDIV